MHSRDDTVEHSMQLNLEDSQKMSFYHAEQCGIKKLWDVKEEVIIPPRVTPCQTLIAYAKAVKHRIVQNQVYERSLLVSLFLIHLFDVGLEIYFFCTISVRYFAVALLHLFFILLPFLSILFRFLVAPGKKCEATLVDHLVIEALGINNIWSVDLGWFPALKDLEYHNSNYFKRMVFYILMDLPLLTLKILNNF